MYFLCLYKDISQNKGILVPVGLENEIELFTFMYVLTTVNPVLVSSIFQQTCQFKIAVFFLMFPQLAL